MNDYTDIIARLEKADGPNFRLEQEIMWAVKEVPERHRSDNDNPPNYTNSIDAALMLIPGVLHWIAGFGQCSEDEPLGGASIFEPGQIDLPLAEAEGATVAIAICICALKARAAMGGT